jgi:hypothetical protein
MRKILLSFIFTLSLNHSICAILPEYLKHGEVCNLKIGSIMQDGEDEWELTEVKGEKDLMIMLYKAVQINDTVIYFFHSGQGMKANEKDEWVIDEENPSVYAAIKFTKKKN